MDISALSPSISGLDLQTQVNTAVLSMNLDMVEDMGDAVIKMMEQSVAPHLGQNIDIKL